MSDATPGAYKHVIVGTDGSATADRAVQAAIAIAKTTGAILTVATAWYREMADAPVASERVQIPGGDLGAHEAKWAEQTAFAASQAARQAGVADARPATPEGGPAETLLRLAEERANSLLVVGSLGLGERTERILGNIPHQITHHAIRDALIIQTGNGQSHLTWPRVALATDGSATAAVAIEHGYKLARSLGSVPVLITVARDQASGDRILDKAASQFEDGTTLERHVEVSKDIVDGLVTAASQYDLLVIGNKGMSGPSRLLGSVANSVTHEVPTDMLLVNSTR